MTKKEKPKTTINIAPADMGPLADLALALGFKRGRSANVTAMLDYQIQMIELFGVRIVAEALRQENLEALAEALAPERLEEVAEGMQEDSDAAR